MNSCLPVWGGGRHPYRQSRQAAEVPREGQLRRSFEDASERSPTHLLQAFAAEAKLTLAQVEVDGKSNEMTTNRRIARPPTRSCGGRW